MTATPEAGDLRFCLDFGPLAWARDRSPDAVRRTLDVARAADTAGIDAIWASEDPEGWDAFAVLGALATVTSRAALGTSVTSPYPRHPNLLAASVATLDRLSQGRAVLGLGRGQAEWHGDALGIDTGKPLAVMRETVQLLRSWWREPYRASSTPGDHFQVRDWERILGPQTSPPIYLAAAGPRGLALAGEQCDGVIFNVLTSVDTIREAIPLARKAADDAGRDSSALAFVLRTNVEVVETALAERKALDQAKALLALIATLPGMSKLVRVAGFDHESILAEVAALMQTEQVLASGGGFPELRRQGDLVAARQVIPDDYVRKLALVGPLPVVRAWLQELAALGITHVGVRAPRQVASVDDWRRLLRDLR